MKVVGNFRQQYDVGVSFSVFPFADGLYRDAQGVGQNFLTDVVLFSQLFNGFTDANFHLPVPFAL